MMFAKKGAKLKMRNGREAKSMTETEKNTVQIMDIDFVHTTKKNLLHYELFPRLNRQQKCFIVTANPEIVMRTREDEEYKRIVQHADFVIPDGVGIIKAAKIMKQPLPERIPGYELVLDLLNFANVQGLSCYFLGGKDYVNEKMALEVERQYPNIHIAGHHHGFIGNQDEHIVEEIAKSGADIVFVALGMPKQEKWIYKHYDRFSKGLFMGVGGSFDTFVGELPRAPQKWIDLNLEWLYRLLKQPFRVKRITKVFEFMIRILLKRT